MKRAAAEAAIRHLPDAGVVGLGTGSTAKIFIDLVGELVRSGRRLVGVPTSKASRTQAEKLGIPLLADEGPFVVDVCVDGADEVSDALDLVKGGGGALLREKVVNFASKKNVIIVDATKLSPRLGTTWAVPVEVAQFGHAATAAALARLGRPTLRRAPLSSSRRRRRRRRATSRGASYGWLHQRVARRQRTSSATCRASPRFERTR